jgi:hypothetical protein
MPVWSTISALVMTVSTAPFGAGALGLAHAVADHLAAAELHLLAIGGQVALDLDPEVGVGEADLVAGRGAEHVGIGGAGDAGGHGRDERRAGALRGGRVRVGLCRGGPRQFGSRRHGLHQFGPGCGGLDRGRLDRSRLHGSGTGGDLGDGARRAQLGLGGGGRGGGGLDGGRRRFELHHGSGAARGQRGAAGHGSGEAEGAEGEGEAGGGAGQADLRLDDPHERPDGGEVDGKAPFLGGGGQLSQGYHRVNPCR